MTTRDRLVSLAPLLGPGQHAFARVGNCLVPVRNLPREERVEEVCVVHITTLETSVDMVLVGTERHDSPPRVSTGSSPIPIPQRGERDES